MRDATVVDHKQILDHETLSMWTLFYVCLVLLDMAQILLIT
jgi:hypothetical protein